VDGAAGPSTVAGRAVADGPAGTGITGAGAALLLRSGVVGATVGAAGAVPGSARGSSLPAPARSTAPARTATPTAAPAAAAARRSGRRTRISSRSPVRVTGGSVARMRSAATAGGLNGERPVRRSASTTWVRVAR
jgi:hypothetical protein